MFGKRKKSRKGSNSRRVTRKQRKPRSLQIESLETRNMLSAAAIIAENALQGTSSSEWDIDGAGSDNIQGYAAQMSVNHGERVDFKIATDADDYRIDIYRMGYYQGLGARKVATISPNASLANDQPDPEVDFETGLVDAGNWRVSASWNTPQNAVSGVYIAKLVREDGAFGESHIIFIVRDDDGQSDILMQTADTTWVAYSDWGGSSLYGNNFLPQGRAYEVSYNRPLTTRSRAEGNNFFWAEFPLVRFLESNGFDVSYTSGIDTARRGGELLEHDVFISVGHDEYWSGEQRANVEAARDAGVNLMFLGGNDVFWKIRWEDSIDGSNTPYRTLVNYKETHANAKIDPLDDVWTGTWRDPRFASTTDGGRPENELTGTIFTVNGDGSIGTSINVGAADGDLRFWRNTSVANLTGSQIATLGDYVLGFEWNEDLDNGFRPAGLMRLSSTTVNVSSYIQDYGSSYAPSTAHHTLTLYRAASGALVFGAGTIQYSWGLDNWHDGPATSNDPAMQQATINMLADMGVQPSNLRSGLVQATMSTDSTKPTSFITSPTDGMTVQANAALTIRGTAQDGGGGRIASVEVSVDGGASWHRATGRESWTYTWTPRSNGQVTILSRAVDDSGNIEVPVGGVTVNPPQSPGVYSLWNTATTPATVDSGDNSPVEVGMRFRVDTAGAITALRFYKAAANGGTHVAKIWNSNGTLLASATFTNETSSGWQTVQFDSPVSVSAGQTYIASYTAPNGRYSVSRNYFSPEGVDNGPLHGVASGAAGTNGVYTYSIGGMPNDSYQASNYWVDVVFNTSVAADTMAPTVTKFGEATGASVITVGSAFAVTFSEAMNPATINVSTMTMVRPDGRLVPSGCCPTPGGWCSGCPLLNAVNNTPVPVTVSYDAASRTARLTPNSPLDPNTVYTIIVNSSGVKDLAGNGIENDTWSSVYTSNQVAPVISSMFDTSTVPTTVDSGDGSAVELGMRFTADQNGHVTGARFYKAAGNTGTHTASLWSSSGQRLATATFTNETASGWQTVNFGTSVAVTAGTTYVISYHTSSGHYSVARNYFSSAREVGPLNTPANAGVFAYGSGNVFPSGTYQGSNYYVDVLLSSAPGGDTVAPTITNFNPFDGTGNVPVNPSIKVYFSEAMDASTIIPATVKLLDGGNNAVPATLTYDAATRTATLTPTSPLAFAMNYTIFVLGGAAGVRDLAGNTMAQNLTSAFATEIGTVQDTTPPTVAAFSPTNNTTGASPTTAVTITFSEAMNAATVKASNVYLLRNGTNLVSTTFAYNATTRTVTLTPVSPLAADTSYTIYVLGGSTGVKDLSDNALVQNASSVFRTAVSTPGDTVPPTITGFSPTGGSVSTNSSITINFSEALTASSVNSTSIQLRHAATNVAVAGTLSYTPGSTAVTFTPSSPLTASTNYLIVVQGGASGIRDAAGNAMTNMVTSAFTTAAPADTTAPGVSAFNPTSGSGSVTTAVAPVITFTEAMNASTINSNTVFIRNASNVVVPATVTYNASNNTATVTPSAALANSTAYTIVVKGGASGVKDLAGNALAADATSAFITAAAADTTAPTVTSFNPVTGSLTVATSASPVVTFSEAMNASTINSSTVFLRTASNVVVPASVTYNAANNTATVTPTAALANGTSYTIVVVGGAAGVKDLAGNSLATNATSAFSTVAGSPPVATPDASLWGGTATPAIVDSGDTSAVELGVRFSSTTSGFVTGIRFYKAAANTGTHTGSLWSASGQLLATGTFVNETASGWQTLMFSSPVAITAGTTYVASYQTNSGHYSVSRNYFGSQFSSGNLRVAANGGVYRYGATGAMPSSAYQASNYWVDVVVSTTAPVDTLPPQVSSFNPTNGSSNIATTHAPVVTFSEAMNASTVNSSTVFLRTASGVALGASVSYNATNRTATITPTTAWSNSTTFTIVVKGGSAGVKDLAGNALAADSTSTFTTVSNTVPPTNASLWNTTTTPAIVDSGDSAAVELGVRFSSTTNGFITGVRFYKAAANTGVHAGSLWSSSGQLLATGTFVNETASGWQTLVFSAPVAITAGTTYVASYQTNAGHYSVSRNYFGSQFASGNLRVAANGGVYRYGTGSGMPSSTFQGSNYWVDVLFTT